MSSEAPMGSVISRYGLEQVVLYFGADGPLVLLTLYGAAREILVEEARCQLISHDRLYSRCADHDLFATGVCREPDCKRGDFRLINGADWLWLARDPSSDPVELWRIHSGELNHRDMHIAVVVQ